MKISLTIATGALIIILSGCTSTLSYDIEKARDSGVPIIITSMQAGYPDYAGGVDVDGGFTNLSSRTMKYVDVTMLPYNQVGDVVSSSIGGRTRALIRETGPVEPGHGLHIGQGDAWYNQTIRCIEIVAVKVTYMDGETEHFKGEDIRRILASSIENSCSVN